MKGTGAALMFFLLACLLAALWYLGTHPEALEYLERLIK